MLHPDSVNTLVGRLATFNTHHSTKRASSTKKKATLPATWPHDTPTPEELARSGFYYKPSSGSNDNVMCFVCHRQLDGWEPNDNAGFEHLTHSPDCGWALNVCISLRTGDPNRAEDDPMGDKMMNARRETFLDSWPHEGKKGWKCNTQKLIEAGWCYDPCPEYDDGVTCFYCNLSVDGWEPKDNPMEEHLARSPDCYFFKLTKTYAESRKSMEGRKRMGKSRSSKASRTSFESNSMTFSEGPSLLSIGNLPATEDDSIATAATTETVKSITGKGRKGAKKTKAKTRGIRKDKRDKKSVTTNAEVLGETIINMDMASEPPQVVQPPKRTTRGSVANKNLAFNTSSLHDPPRLISNKTQRTRKKQQCENEDESNIHSETVPSASSSTEILSTVGGVKRTSDGIEKVNSSDRTDYETYYSPKPKPKRGKKAKVMKSPMRARLSEVMEQAAEMPEPKANREIGRKKAKNAKFPHLDSNTQMEEETSILDNSVLSCLRVFPDPPGSSHRQLSPFLPKTPSQKSVSASTDVPLSSTVPHLSPLKSCLSNQECFNPDALNPVQQEKSTILSVSSQSSNIENIPPSSRPSFRQRLGTITPRSPAAPQTVRAVRFPLHDISAPTASPSKRANTIPGGFLTSTLTWTRIDLENIFLRSPQSGRVLGTIMKEPDENGSREQVEDEITDSDVNEHLRAVSGDGIEEVVKRVQDRFTSPEKKMSVEEWVAHQARKGEESLKEKCELMVSAFEKEGARAASVLQGIGCV